MTHSPEFSRRLPLNRIGSGIEENVEANDVERQALAKRLGLIALDSLTCRFRLTPTSPKHVLADGWLMASVKQTCVITGEVFADALTEAFSVRFVPREDLPEDEFDIDSIDLDAADDVPHDDRALDLGEAAAEQLALMLDPYPRKPGAGLEDAVDMAPRENAEEEHSVAGAGQETRKPNPFAALATLQKAKKGE